MSKLFYGGQLWCYAGDLQNRFRAGLSISGQDENGELEWLGSQVEWMEYYKSIDDYS